MIGHNYDISIIRLEWFVTSAEFLLSILFQFLRLIIYNSFDINPIIFVCGRRKQRLGTYMYYSSVDFVENLTTL
jgi:hypothetical protein